MPIKTEREEALLLEDKCKGFVNGIIMWNDSVNRFFK